MSVTPGLTGTTGASPAVELGALLDQTVAAASAVGRLRDLVLMRMGEVTLVIACDSNASIGGKPGDALAQDPRETGYSAAKVPVMEVMAVGARPALLINNLCCEMLPTGRLLLNGIHRLLAEADLDVVVTGSDETNMPTMQTGLGVTVVGVVATGGLRCGRAVAGDTVWCVGEPRDGRRLPFVDGRPGIAGPREVRAALANPGVHEVLPVGSRGVRHEAGQLASTAGLTFGPNARTSVELDVSAGPSTCFLVAATGEAGATLAAAVAPCAITAVGRLTASTRP